MTVSALNMQFCTKSGKFRDYKTFSHETFKNSLRSNKMEEKISYYGEGFEKFCEICVKTLRRDCVVII